MRLGAAQPVPYPVRPGTPAASTSTTWARASARRSMRHRRRRLRLERTRRDLRQPGARAGELRQRAPGRHDQPDLRLPPQRRLRLDHRRCVRPNGVGWPAEYLGDYLFADYGCGKIFRLDPSGPGSAASTSHRPRGEQRCPPRVGPSGRPGALLHDLRRWRPGTSDQLQRRRIPRPAAAISATPVRSGTTGRRLRRRPGSSDPDPGDTIDKLRVDVR